MADCSELKSSANRVMRTPIAVAELAKPPLYRPEHMFPACDTIQNVRIGYFAVTT